MNQSKDKRTITILCYVLAGLFVATLITTDGFSDLLPQSGNKSPDPPTTHEEREAEREWREAFDELAKRIPRNNWKAIYDDLHHRVARIYEEADRRFPSPPARNLSIGLEFVLVKEIPLCPHPSCDMGGDGPIIAMTKIITIPKGHKVRILKKKDCGTHNNPHPWYFVDIEGIQGWINYIAISNDQFPSNAGKWIEYVDKYTAIYEKETCRKYNLTAEDLVIIYEIAEREGWDRVTN